jgi:parvulin-like peptidyl-prolyl isomerase
MRGVLAIATLTALLPLGGFAQAPATGAAAPPAEELPQGGALTTDTPVLEVDGRPVAKIWYDRALQEVMRTLEGSAGAHGAGNEQVRRLALERLIEQELLYSLALKQEIPGLDAEVERRFQGFVEKVGGAEAFARGLADQGMEERHVRHILRRDLATEWYVDKVLAADLTVTDEEALSYYDTFKDTEYVHPEKRKIYQILAAESRGETAARERLTEVQQRYRGGEGFGALALEYSDDPLSRLNDGYMGVRQAAELPDAVAEGCFSATVGEITDIVHSPFGWHVFLVTDVEPAQSLSFAEVSDEVRQRALEVKRKKAVEKAVKQAGKETQVEVLMHP